MNSSKNIRIEPVTSKDGDDQDDVFIPYVTHDDYPELTPKAIILGIILAVVLGAANVYLGLLVGMTVSASIPASVVSMAILGCFKTSNILENNIVQTAASAGEALAAGVMFTLPGLLIIQQGKDQGDPTFANSIGWSTFLGENYVYSLFIPLLGGLLGIAWSIPLRRALIVELKPPLRFPEGVATSQVLKSGEKGGTGVKAVACGGGIGGLLTLLQTFGCWFASPNFGWLYNNMYPTYFGFSVKPALMAVGYIVGPHVGGVLFLGAMINLMIIVPSSAAINGRWDEAKWNTTTDGDFNYENVFNAEFAQTRYIGVGLMLIGAVWSLISIRKPLVVAAKFGIREFKTKFCGGKEKNGNELVIERTNRDIPLHWVLFTVVATLVPLYIIFSVFATQGEAWGYNIVMALIIAIASFLFSAVAAYMAGLVGSSNNPVSGVTICSSLIISLCIDGMYGTDDEFGAALAVLMTCAVASACTISSDNMQDLKCSYLLGGTPWRQEFIMGVGVLAASLVVGPVLEILNQAYGIGGNSPKQGHLQAPQATIVASIPAFIATGTMPWGYIGAGIGFGVFIIICDLLLERSKFNFRLPVLAFAIAIYLPPDYLIPIFAGSLVHLVAKTNPEDYASEGILYAAGLVAGDCIMGVIIAIPLAIKGSADFLQFIDEPPMWAALFPLFIIWFSMFYIAKYEPFQGRPAPAAHSSSAKFSEEYQPEQATVA